MQQVSSSAFLANTLAQQVFLPSHHTLNSPCPSSLAHYIKHARTHECTHALWTLPRSPQWVHIVKSCSFSSLSRTLCITRTRQHTRQFEPIVSACFTSTSIAKGRGKDHPSISSFEEFIRGGGYSNDCWFEEFSQGGRRFTYENT